MKNKKISNTDEKKQRSPDEIRQEEEQFQYTKPSKIEDRDLDYQHSFFHDSKKDIYEGHIVHDTLIDDDSILGCSDRAQNQKFHRVGMVQQKNPSAAKLSFER